MEANSFSLAFNGAYLFIKIGLLILVGFYVIFSLIVLRQISLMTEIVSTKSAPVLRFFGVIHLGLALGIFILTLGLLFF